MKSKEEQIREGMMGWKLGQELKPEMSRFGCKWERIRAECGERVVLCGLWAPVISL